MQAKEVRGFEFLVIARQILAIFAIWEPSILEQIEWIKYLDDIYLLSPLGGLLFFIGAYKFDGFRFSVFSMVITEISLGFLSLKFKNQALILFLLSIALISVIISSAFYYFFPVLRNISITGRFRVGYKAIIKQGLQLALFYPTLDENKKSKDIPYICPQNYDQKATTQSDKWESRLLGIEYFQWLHQTLLRQPRKRMPIAFPKFVLQWLSHFITKKRMGVIHEAKIDGQFNNNTPPLIVFSHGISSNMNYSSGYCKELASKGLIVASIQHHDKDQLGGLSIPPKTEDYIVAQHKSVLVRRDQVNFVLDEFVSGNKLKEVLPGSVSVKSAVMMGHSYGGQNAALSGLEEDRISGVVLLDPVLNLFELSQFTDLLNKKVSKPFLIIVSDNFDKMNPFYGQSANLKRLIEHNQDNKLLLAVHMKNTEHNDFIDISLLQPKELQILRKDICSLEKVPQNHLLFNKLVEFFLQQLFSKETHYFNSDNVLLSIQEFCSNQLKMTCPFERVKVQ